MASATYLILRGGLGNQLFQLIAAESFTKGRPMYIECGFPDRNFPREEQIHELVRTRNIEFILSKKLLPVTNKLIDKCFGISARNSSNLIVDFGRKFLEIISSLYFSVYYRKILRVQISKGPGFSRVRTSRFNILLIGYFQTYMYFNSLNEKQVLPSKFETEKMRHYFNLSLTEEPLVIHQRLGDYTTQDVFGIPNEQYLENSIETIFQQRSFGAIWLFSDNAGIARSRIPIKYQSMVREIDDVGLTPLDVLKIMTLGSGFIIANSSFSWWAAMLAQDQSAPVVAPKPWFRGIEDPALLIPSSWFRLDVEFENQDIV